MGHIEFRSAFDHFIHAFHMPMFFMISGYFYKKGTEPRLCIYKNTRTLLLPYISFGSVYCIVYWLKNGFSSGSLISLLCFNTRNFPIAGALWFLTALFFTIILYSVLDKYDKKILIIPLVLIGSYADRFLSYPLPLGLSASFVGIGLFFIGQKIRENENKLTRFMNLNLLEIGILGIITTVLIFLNGYVNMREGQYAWIVLFWVNAILAFFVGVSLSKIIERHLNTRWMRQWILSIGKDSIVYVCLNQIVISVFLTVFARSSIPMTVSKIIVLVLTLISLFVFSVIFTRTKFRLFLGK